MTSTVSSIKDFAKSFLLLELFKGMALTGRHFLSRTSPCNSRKRRRR